MGGTSFDGWTGLAAMPDGGLVAAGYGTGALTGLPLTAVQADGVVARWTPMGLAWSMTVGGPGYDYLDGVATDASGNLIVAGRMQTGAMLGGPPLVVSGSQDGAIAKYDPMGAFQWQRAFGGTMDDDAAAVATDAAGNVYVTGYFRGTADFGTGPLSVPFTSDLDVFIASYMPDGTPRFAKHFVNNGNDRGYAIAATGSAVALGGSFYNTIDFGGGAFNSGSSQTDGFVAVFDLMGKHLWSRQIGASDGIDEVRGVAWRGTDLAVCGTVVTAVDFGGVTPPVLGSADAFVALYSSTGALVWVRRLGGVGNDYCRGVAYDAASDTIAVVGSFEQTASFGGSSLTTRGSSDAYRARYAAGTGALMDVMQFGGAGDEQAQAVGAGAVGGYFFGSGTFAGVPLMSAGQADAFLARP
jgi:hypothetical protein